MYPTCKELPDDPGSGSGAVQGGEPFSDVVRLPCPQDEGEGEAGPDCQVLQGQTGRAEQELVELSSVFDKDFRSMSKVSYHNFFNVFLIIPSFNQKARPHSNAHSQTEPNLTLINFL